MLTDFKIKDSPNIKDSAKVEYSSDFQLGFARGFAITEKFTVLRIAKRMLDKGYPISEVADIVKASEKELLKLLNHSNLS